MCGQRQPALEPFTPPAVSRPATPERAYGSTLEALVAIREKLTTLVRTSSGERIASGYWLTVSPSNLVEQLADLNVVIGSVARDLQRTMRGSVPTESTGLLLFGRLGVLCAQFVASTEIAPKEMSSYREPSVISANPFVELNPCSVLTPLTYL